MSNWCLPTPSRAWMSLGRLRLLLSTLLRSRHAWIVFGSFHSILFNILMFFRSLQCYHWVGYGQKSFLTTSCFSWHLCASSCLLPCYLIPYLEYTQRNLMITSLWHRLLPLFYSRNKTHWCFCCHLFCPMGSCPQPASPSPASWPHDWFASCMPHFPFGLAETQADHANWLKWHSRS